MDRARKRGMITFVLPQELEIRFKLLCKLRGMSCSHGVRRAIRAEIRRFEKSKKTIDETWGV